MLNRAILIISSKASSSSLVSNQAELKRKRKKGSPINQTNPWIHYLMFTKFAFMPISLWFPPHRRASQKITSKNKLLATGRTLFPRCGVLGFGRYSYSSVGKTLNWRPLFSKIRAGSWWISYMSNTAV
jgi:hypothetical protein